MDFITGLPSVRGYSVILVVVDRLSKYGHFIPVPADFSSQKVADTFLHNIVKLHGISSTIVSDRDKVFTSGFWKHLMKLQGSQLCHTSAYHPQSDGQTERTNQFIEGYLRNYVSYQQDDWDRHLPSCEFSYNNSLHSTIGLSLFQANRGINPQISPRPLQPSVAPAAQAFASRTQKVKEDIHAAMLLSQ